MKHVTGHRSAHVSSGYHERCPSHMLPPLESHFGSTVGSTTRVCRDDLWHRIWHRSQRLDNRSRVAAPIASPWPSTLLSARLSVVPVRQQSSDVTGARRAVARWSVTSPMDEGGVARLVVTRRSLHPSPRRCGFEPVRLRLLCNTERQYTLARTIALHRCVTLGTAHLWDCRPVRGIAPRYRDNALSLLECRNSFWTSIHSIVIYRIGTAGNWMRA